MHGLVAATLALAVGSAPAVERRNCNEMAFWIPTMGVVGSAAIDVLYAFETARAYNKRLAFAPFLDAPRRAIGLQLSLRTGRGGSSPSRVQEAPQNKSPALALGLSAVATLAPMLLPPEPQHEGTKAVLVIGGIVVGPSIGHFYADHVAYGLTMDVARALGAAVAIAVAANCIDEQLGST